MYYLFGGINCEETKKIKEHLRSQDIGLFYIPTSFKISYLGIVKEVLEKHSEEDFPILIISIDNGEEKETYEVIKDYVSIEGLKE